MICTDEKPLTQKQSLLDHKFNTAQKKKLVANWKTVNGKLICQ